MKNLKLVLGVLVAILVVGLLIFYKPSTTPAPYEQPKQTGINYIAPGTNAVKNPNVFFAIQDKAAGLEDLQSIVMNVQDISVFVPKKGWVKILSAPTSFDLLQLKQNGFPQFLASLNLEKGTYDQMRILINKVVITQNNVSKEAKLPSGELKIKTNLLIEDRSVSAVVFDFLADKSLHVTGNNMYIFAPVIHLTTTTGVKIQQLGKKIDIFGGVGKFIADLGMDESGDFKVNLALDPNAKIEIVNDVLVVIPKDTDQTKLKISVETAIATALNGGYIEKLLSAKIVTRDNKLAWRILGTKNKSTIKIYVDAGSGEVMGIEY